MTYQYQQPAAYYPQVPTTYPQQAPPAAAPVPPAVSIPDLAPADNDSGED